MSRPRTRLKAPTQKWPLHVVLVEPEIPPNTGNVARLCAATGCSLHLVGRLGFQIDEHAVRRAGLDYWHLVDVHQHQDLGGVERWARAGRSGREPRTHLFSAHASRSYLDARFESGDLLVFGRESVGLPEELLSARPESVIGIPILGAVRSLNLSNAVAVAVYEALRQLGMLVAAAAT